MKKLMWLVGVSLVLSVAAQAAIVREVEIVQTIGSTAYNSAGDGTLTWSMGSSGAIILDDWSYFEFGGATVTATFTGVTDLSSGGIAKATFDSGTWSVHLAQDGKTVDMTGGIVGLYREEEVVPSDEVALDGRAIISVTSAVFTGFGDTLVWGNDHQLGGIMASILFPPGYILNDYSSDYVSSNTTITLLADETAIPEPATMLLLGLGAVLLRKKK